MSAYVGNETTQKNIRFVRLYDKFTSMQQQ
jgi:hypothetical protein